MFNRMISHFGGERKSAEKSKQFNALDSRYVDGLTKLYARVYGN